MNVNDIHRQIARLKESFLCAAARGGRLEECASLLDLGADTEWPHRPEDDTPLLAAVRNSHKECAALLLAHGADPTRRDGRGNTVMHLAAIVGDEGLASLFAPNAMSLSMSTNRDGMTAMDIAVEKHFFAFATHLHNLCETDEEGDEGGGTGTTTITQQLIDINGNDSFDEEDEEDTIHRIRDRWNDHLQDGRSNASEGEIFDEANPEGAQIDSFNDASETIEFDSKSLRQKSCTEALLDQLRDMAEISHVKSIQFQELKDELDNLKQEYSTMKRENQSMRSMLNGEETNLSQKSLAELTSLEEQLKRSLEKVAKAKEMASNNLEEERICVICRENRKSVLFLSCRHLCVCGECGQKEELDKCPLCRVVITERINVYS
mmetsp:Transcript_31208/g.62824  ORF Transcript_31208/g.62824 Transcript_31208/m.62824 type:complete len:378 (+) Transcript_31208:416-1549(+)